MASPQASQHFRSRNKMEMWDHDPGGTAAAVTTPDGGTTERWFDMRDFGRFVGAAMATIATSGITKLEIVGATDQAGSNLTVLKDSGALAADAVGDWGVLEVTAEELRQEAEDAGFALRYVALRITMGTATDEAVVAYIGQEPTHQYDSLTPASTIA